MFFVNRSDAGKQLLQQLQQYKDSKDCIVLALPRGGVVVAHEVARGLRLPLDIIVPRKIGAPNNPEFAIGALTEDGESIINEDIIQQAGISENYIAEQIKKEKGEAQRRLMTYRGDRPPVDLTNKIVILVDDGIATGATIRAAIQSAYARVARKIIVATPVSARDSLQLIEQEADEVIALHVPDFFAAVGQFYEEFGQTTDEEVMKILKHYS